MKVAHLIKLLSVMDPESDVVLAFQPNYPLEFTTACVNRRSDFDEVFEDPTHEPREGDGKANDTVIACGGHLRYGNGGAWNH